MRVLFLGDVVGTAGCRAVCAMLPRLVEQGRIDFVVANCENASAAGAGIDPALAGDLLRVGVDVLTSGNHVFRLPEIGGMLADEPALLRPANFPPGAPGRGWVVRETAGGVAVGVVNLIGRTFMESVDCPFRVLEECLSQIRARTPVIIVDMHAEATSEKGAMGWFADGRVSAVLGSHTHVQTADERVLPGGTAFVTDAGMCGPVDSVIGVTPAVAIRRFVTRMPARFTVAAGPVVVQGVVVEVEAGTGRATGITRVRERAS